MPFFDKLGETIGKASQVVSDAAKDISEGFQNAKQAAQAAASQRTAENTGKCPNCGQPLGAMQAVCPLCGFELQTRTSASSVSTLAKELSDLEKGRRALSERLVSSLAGRSTSATDEKIASAIKNFVVPNTKGDIFEFMLLAAGNMNAKLLAGRKDAEGNTPEIIVKAWAAKFEQTYTKARLAFGDDADFSKIKELYERKMQEIEDARPHGLFSRRK